MEQLKTSLKLRTKTLLTFQNKSVKKAGFADTDPTSSTMQTITGIMAGTMFAQQKKV